MKAALWNFLSVWLLFFFFLLCPLKCSFSLSQTQKSNESLVYRICNFRGFFPLLFFHLLQQKFLGILSFERWRRICPFVWACKRFVIKRYLSSFVKTAFLSCCCDWAFEDPLMVSLDERTPLSWARVIKLEIETRHEKINVNFAIAFIRLVSSVSFSA